MKPEPDYFETPRKTLAWAREAKRELQAEYQAYFQSAGLIETRPTNIVTLEKTDVFRLTKPLPDILMRKASEALLNVRHGFDQLAYAAQVAVTGSEPGAHLYFPWAENPNDLAGRLRKSFDPSLHAAISSVEPYPQSTGYVGGNSLMRALARLANDKHTVGFSAEADLANARFPDVSLGEKGAFEMGLHWDSERREGVLLRYWGEVTRRGNYQIQGMLLFDDSRLPHKVDVGAALTRFSQMADRCMTALTDAIRHKAK